MVQLAPLADTPQRAAGGHGGDTGAITAAVPGLAALVDLDEADVPEGARPRRSVATCQSKPNRDQVQSITLVMLAACNSCYVVGADLSYAAFSWLVSSVR